MTSLQGWRHRSAAKTNSSLGDDRACTRPQRLIPPFLSPAGDTADSFSSLAAGLALYGYIPLLGKPVH
jgi:hypothetical protein